MCLDVSKKVCSISSFLRRQHSSTVILHRFFVTTSYSPLGMLGYKHMEVSEKIGVYLPKKIIHPSESIRWISMEINQLWGSPHDELETSPNQLANSLTDEHPVMGFVTRGHIRQEYPMKQF